MPAVGFRRLRPASRLLPAFFTPVAPVAPVAPSAMSRSPSTFVPLPNPDFDSKRYKPEKIGVAKLKPDVKRKPGSGSARRTR